MPVQINYILLRPSSVFDYPYVFEKERRIPISYKKKVKDWLGVVVSTALVLSSPFVQDCLRAFPTKFAGK